MTSSTSLEKEKYKQDIPGLYKSAIQAAKRAEKAKIETLDPPVCADEEAEVRDRGINPSEQQQHGLRQRSSIATIDSVVRRSSEEIRKRIIGSTGGEDKAIKGTIDDQKNAQACTLGEGDMFQKIPVESASNTAQIGLAQFDYIENVAATNDTGGALDLSFHPEAPSGAIAAANAKNTKEMPAEKPSSKPEHRSLFYR